jgi:hypothetical protein
MKARLYNIIQTISRSIVFKILKSVLYQNYLIKYTLRMTDFENDEEFLYFFWRRRNGILPEND